MVQVALGIPSCSFAWLLFLLPYQQLQSHELFLIYVAKFADESHDLDLVEVEMIV